LAAHVKFNVTSPTISIPQFDTTTAGTNVPRLSHGRQTAKRPLVDSKYKSHNLKVAYRIEATFVVLVCGISP
jgi:hypothetical protein